MAAPIIGTLADKLSGRVTVEPHNVSNLFALIGVAGALVFLFALALLFVAGDQTERFIAIGMIPASFVLILVWAIALAIVRPTVAGAKTSEVARELAAGETVKTKALAKDADNIIVGKDGDYTIDHPGPGWQVTWYTLEELLLEEGFAPQHIAVVAQNLGDITVRNVLNIQAEDTYDIGIKPGQTRINSWHAPIFMHAPARVRMLIMSRNRFLSTRAAEDTLYSFAVERLAGYLQSAAITGIDQIVRRDGSVALASDAVEKLEDVIVNGMDHQSLEITTSHVFLQNTAHYFHILVMSPDGAVVGDEDVNKLKHLVTTFQLGTEPNTQAKRREALMEAQIARTALVNAQGPMVVQNSILLALTKLRALPLDTAEGLAAARGEIQRFFAFASHLNVDPAVVGVDPQLGVLAAGDDDAAFLELLRQHFAAM